MRAATNRLIAVAVLIVLAATFAVAEPQETPGRASREAAISLLRREGIVGEKTRVVDVRWGWRVLDRHYSPPGWRDDQLARRCQCAGLQLHMQALTLLRRPRPNQSMKLTASKPAIYALRVCHPRFLLRGSSPRARRSISPSR